MSSVIVSNPQDLSSNSGQPSLRLREINLPDRIKALLEITLSLLTELESLERLSALAPERSLRLEDEVKRFEIALIRAASDSAGAKRRTSNPSRRAPFFSKPFSMACPHPALSPGAGAPEPARRQAAPRFPTLHPLLACW